MAIEVKTEGQALIMALVQRHGGLKKTAEMISSKVGRPLDYGLLGRWRRGEVCAGEDWQPLLTPWVPIAAWSRALAANAPPDSPPPTSATPDRVPTVDGHQARVPRVEELQSRLRAIPGELARLREEPAADPSGARRRLLEAEVRALRAAIDAAGVATVAEVEAVRALVRDATRGCEGCRARLADALRAMGASH